MPSSVLCQPYVRATLLTQLVVTVAIPSHPSIFLFYRVTASLMLPPTRKARLTDCRWICNHFSVKGNSCSRKGCRSWDQNRIFRAQSRLFSSSPYCLRQQKYRVETFSFKLKKALRDTKIQWRPIPIGLGIAFLGVFQLYRTKKDNSERKEDEDGRRIGDTPQAEGTVNSKAGPW